MGIKKNNLSRKLESRRGISSTIMRYLIRDMLFAFLVSFLFFFFIFFVNQILLLARDILSKQVPFYQVALLIIYALPGVIAISAPFASLVGTLMTVGRLSSDNEVLVMLSSGISYRSIIIPAFAMGVFISITSFFVNDVLLPAGTIRFNRLYRELMASTPALELAANSVRRFQDTVIVTGPVTGTDIENVLIFDRTAEGERRVIMAQNVELVDSGADGISLDMNDAFVQSSKETVRDDYDYASSSFLRYWIPQDDFIQAITSVGPREMSSVDLKRDIDGQAEELSMRLDERYSRGLSQGLYFEESMRIGQRSDYWNRRESYMTVFIREMETAQILRDDRNLLLYRLEYYQKFSIPFGAFSFVFLAVPLGLMAKKSGQTVGFIFGLIIALIYWSMLLGGRTLGVRMGYSPFLSMWAPNILAGGIGLILCIVRLRR